MEFIRAQLTKIPKITPVNLSQSTVLITGANNGLGLEAAREILYSHPKRLILAVRNLEKGEDARNFLTSSKVSATTIEVRKLDQASFKCVQDFVKGVGSDQIDIAILNAGVWNTRFTATGDGYESDLQVNALAPALLSLLLLPNLRDAASSPRPSGAPKPHLTFVTSGLHEIARFPERNLPDGHILAALNDKKKYSQADRYPVTKLINLLWARSLASKVPSSEMIINAPTPGFCTTGLLRNTSGVIGLFVSLAFLFIGRSAQDGARCLVDGAIVKTEETHGKLLSEAVVKAESELERSEEGKELQARIWSEVIYVFNRNGIELPTL